MVGEKVKNETGATFYDVCDVFDLIFGHFLNLPSGLKVNHAFKAKKKRFVKDCAKKWKRYLFSHFGVGIRLRDETRFKEGFSEPGAKPTLLLSFCLTEF